MERLKSTSNLKQIIDTYYDHFMRARQEGASVVWSTIAMPSEIFFAAGLLPFYPESYAALCGSRRQGEELCIESEQVGYPPDLCSYARIILGVVLSGKGPLGPLPHPDLLVACVNQCATVGYWWRALSRYLEVPLLLIDTPAIENISGEIAPHKQRYVEQQIGKLTDFIYQHTGRRVDNELLPEVFSLSRQAHDLYGEILALRCFEPTPYSAGDIFTHLFPMFTLRGTPQAVEHLRLLRDEVKERVAMGVGIPKGKRRLLWDNIPIWFNLKLYDYLASLGGVIVVDTYTQLMANLVPLNESDPLGSLARRCIAVHLNTGLDSRVEFVARLVEEFNVEGMVMHSNRSCKPYSLGQVDIARTISERYDIPYVLIEADQCDPRYFAEEQVKGQLQAFMEMS